MQIPWPCITPRFIVLPLYRIDSLYVAERSKVKFKQKRKSPYLMKNTLQNKHNNHTNVQDNHTTMQHIGIS